jgi:hypothetical protein
MAIAISCSPGAPYASLTPQTISWTGLTTASTYYWTVVGPNGTQDGTMASGAGTTATTTWDPDGGGTYTFYTTLISAAAATPAGALYVEAIN